MKTKFQLESEIADCEVELRSLMDANKEKKMGVEEIRSKKAEIETRRSNLLKEMAQLDAPKDDEGAETRSKLFDAEEWRKLARGEVRSLSIGSTGAINQIKQLFREVADTDEILNKASFYYGPNAATNIPVLAPLGDVSGYAEGTTNVTVDTDASVMTTSITPKAHVSVLPITAEALELNSINLESELPAIFQKAFSKAMHTEMLTGSGATSMKGIFEDATDTNVTTVGSIATNATAAKVSDLVKLALACSGKDEEYTIVLNPSVYSGILADSTAGEDVKLYKEGLIRDKEIEGVKVILDRKAPNTFGAGKIVAVGVPLSRYAIGVGGSLVIDPIKVKGDTNTYFQATMFFGGKQIAVKDIIALKTNA